MQAVAVVAVAWVARAEAVEGPAAPEAVRLEVPRVALEAQAGLVVVAVVAAVSITTFQVATEDLAAAVAAAATAPAPVGTAVSVAAAVEAVLRESTAHRGLLAVQQVLLRPFPPSTSAGLAAAVPVWAAPSSTK